MPPQKELTREQKILLASRGYLPDMWEVIVDGRQSMLIRRKDRLDAAVIFKEGSPEYRSGK